MKTYQLMYYLQKHGSESGLLLFSFMNRVNLSYKFENNFPRQLNNTYFDNYYDLHDH